SYCSYSFYHVYVLHSISSIIHPPPSSTLFPYTTLFRSRCLLDGRPAGPGAGALVLPAARTQEGRRAGALHGQHRRQPGLLEFERSEEHTSELQSQSNIVCRLLLEKKKKK